MQRMECDVMIVGGGIAGAAAAYALAPHLKCILLERESQPGYHSTGRSAALFSETYGNRVIRALSVASRAFLTAPPPGFSDVPLLGSRGVLHFGAAGKAEKLDAAFAEASQLVASVRRVTPAQVAEIVPVLRPEAIAGGGLAEPDAMDMDVDALHRGFLRGAAAAGLKLVTDADVQAIERDGADWLVSTSAMEVKASIVINAAGAWCDKIGELAGARPIGLQPKRRTAFTIDLPAGTDFRHWPLTLEADETLYFKPDAGRLLISPADATPSPPCDAQPDEMDIAIAVERFEEATTLNVRRLASRWAGLRSFVPDGSIVAGFDGRLDGFFWLAGQGGYGIQTAAAMSRVVGQLARGLPLPADIQDLHVSAADISPERLR